MPRQFQLLERGFHGGTIRERGEIVTLRDDELPGRHMRPHVPPPPVKPVVVDALPKAPQTVFVTPTIVLPAEPAAPLEPAPPRIAVDAAPYSPGYLILDTETNGFDDPRLASIAMIFVDADLRIEHEYDRLVRPVDWEMSAEASRVNGLDMETLLRRGCDLIEPLIVFELALAWGRVMVAHNAEFDLRVMRGELRRQRRGSAVIPYSSVCTMLAARRMVGNGGLAKAYQALFEDPLVDHHDAMADARACLAVLRGLRARGLDIARETKQESGA